MPQTLGELIANNTAGYYGNRDIAEKKVYTFSGIQLHALGNMKGNGEPETKLVYELIGVQINSVQSPNYQSDAAEIGSVSLDLRAHGWTIMSNV